MECEIFNLRFLNRQFKSSLQLACIVLIADTIGKDISGYRFYFRPLFQKLQSSIIKGDSPGIKRFAPYRL
jgi:hypothetical protein